MADKELSDVSSQQNNPLSRKLNKILESRLDNDKVCEILHNIVVILVDGRPTNIRMRHRKTGQADDAGYL